MGLSRVKARVETLGIIPQDEIQPCSEAEVHALEQRLGLLLPEVYKEFLLWMGHGAGRLMRGSRFFYQDLPGLREAAVTLLNENNVPALLPKEAFVFYMHQGYQFAFFQVSEGNDPPVYYYNEGADEKTFVISHRRFSEFLENQIEEQARLLEMFGDELGELNNI